MDNGYSACFTTECEFRLLVCAFTGLVILGTGQDGGGSHIFCDILRIIERHRPAASVATDLFVALVAIFMKILTFTALLVEMAVSV